MPSSHKPCPATQLKVTVNQLAPSTTSDSTTSLTVQSSVVRLPEVDVLRGAAALWVMLSHYLPHWDEHLEPVPVIVPNAFGIYAVQLFFVISGFVIFATLDRCNTVMEFCVLRFSRLYPAYWATLLFAVLIAVLLAGNPLWLGGLLVNLTMFQEFLRFPNFDNVYWSLSVELAFYLNAAWLFALGWHRRVHAIVSVWLVTACLWALIERPSRPLDSRDWLAILFALDFAPYFAFGILFYDTLRRSWSRSAAAIFLLAFGAEFLLAGWSGVIVALAVTLLFFAALQGYLAVLVCKPTLWLGAISYSLYLVHRNVGYQALDWLHAQRVNVWMAVTVTIASALILASLCTYLIEQPAMRWMRARYDRVRKRTAR